MSATVCINDGDTHNSPTEQLEAKYPVLVERYALREDSGGAGRFRGGLGCEQVVQALAPFRSPPASTASTASRGAWRAAARPRATASACGGTASGRPSSPTPRSSTSA